MSRFLKNIRSRHSHRQAGHPEYSRGMSYIELIVVLSIFSAMSAIVLFNYSDFQTKVDIKNLASDIALKVVEGQKSSLSGKLPPLAQQVLTDSTWKPSYGVYINPTTDNKSFTYFVDLKNPVQNNFYDASICPGSGECLDNITITKGNYISRLDVFYQGSPTPNPISDLTVSFVRPNSGAIIKSSTTFSSVVSFVQITITSPKLISSVIKIYPSGRIQVN